MKNNLFPFVKLKSFTNGWRWHGKLTEFIKLKYYNNLKNINDLHIQSIADFLNGSILKTKIFEIFDWAIYFNPAPNIEIYFLCERNVKKGDKFTIFFGKNGDKAPVQDLYGFGLIYLILLSTIGNNISFMKSKLTNNKNFISINQIIRDEKRYQNLIYSKISNIQINTNKFIKNINRFPLVEDYILKNGKISIIIKPVKNLYFNFLFSSDSNDILLTKESLKFYPKNLLISLAGLISSAIEREYSIKNKEES